MGKHKEPDADDKFGYRGKGGGDADDKLIKIKGRRPPKPPFGKKK